MGNLKVGMRLGLAFALLLALMVLAMAVAFLGIRNGEEQAGRLQRENLALLNAASAMRVAQLDEAVAIRDFVSLPNVEAQRESRAVLRASDKAYLEAADALERLSAESGIEAARPIIANLKQAHAQVAAKLGEALDLSDNAEFAQAQAVVYGEARPLQAAIATQLNALVALANTTAEARAQTVGAAARRVELELALAVAAALFAGVAATFIITRGIVRPLGSAVELAERVASGDLTGAAPAARRDETGRVLSALSNMQGGLHRLARSIRDSALKVSDASEHISSGNMDLAARTEEQASSLEETAASVEELTATVKQNSENAAKASELARNAADLAESGGRSVASLMQTMEGIQGSSRKVSEIVGLIDGIAFQTNLLALNAAVEAARAGEQGRGFAVVAAEVRSLAARSAEASKEIKQLVGDAVVRTDAGATLAAQAGESMSNVVGVAKDVADLVADIARASEEQRSGIEQVNATILQMEAVTQRNAALVEDNNTLTESLLAQARDLVAAASQFKLEALDRTPARPGTEPLPLAKNAPAAPEPLLRIAQARTR